MSKPLYSKSPPSRPWMPNKPSKTVSTRQSREFDDIVSLQNLIETFPNVKPNDIYVEANYGDDYTGSSFSIFYLQEVPNPNYDSQLKNYEKDWARYKEKLEIYKIEKAKYDLQKKKFEEHYEENRIKALQKELNQLQTSLATKKKNKNLNENK